MSLFRFQLILLGLIKSMYFYCSWEVLISPLSCVWAHLDPSTDFFFYSFLFSFISPSVFQVLVLTSYESLTPTICNANVFNLIVLGCDRVPAKLFLVSLSVERTPTLKMYFLIVIMERIDLLIWNGHTLGLEWVWNSKTRNVFWPGWDKLYGSFEGPQNSASNQDKKHTTAERNHMHSQTHVAYKAQVSRGRNIIGPPPPPPNY